MPTQQHGRRGPVEARPLVPECGGQDHAWLGSSHRGVREVGVRHELRAAKLLLSVGRPRGGSEGHQENPCVLHRLSTSRLPFREWATPPGTIQSCSNNPQWEGVLR